VEDNLDAARFAALAALGGDVDDATVGEGFFDLRVEGGFAPNFFNCA
jgi:hypothetical protein